MPAALVELPLALSAAETVCVSVESACESALRDALAAGDSGLIAEELVRIARRMDESFKSFTLFDGRVCDEHALLCEALRVSPTSSNAYISLADLCTPEKPSQALPDGRTLAQRDLLLEAIRFDRQSARAYCHLSDTLPEGAAGSKVTLLDGRSLSKVQLLTEAIDLDGSRGVSYEKLVHALAESGSRSIKLADGKRYTLKELLLKSYSLNPLSVDDYVDLGKSARDSGVDAGMLPDGTIATERDFYMEALRRDATSARALHYLAKTMRAGEAVTLPDGRCVDRRALFADALRYDEERSSSWAALAACLKAGETMCVSPGGAEASALFSRQDCLLREIALDGGDDDAFFALGASIQSQEAGAEFVVLLEGEGEAGGTNLDARACYLRALSANANMSRAYDGLIRTMSIDGEAILLPDGRSMDRVELDRQAKRLRGELPAAQQQHA